MTSRSVVTSKGQVTIPKHVREVLGIGEADVVEFEVRKGAAVLRPVSGTFLSRFASMAPKERPENWKRVRKRVAEDVARRQRERRRA